MCEPIAIIQQPVRHVPCASSAALQDLSWSSGQTPVTTIGRLRLWVPEDGLCLVRIWPQGPAWRAAISQAISLSGGDPLCLAPERSQDLCVL